MSVPESCVCGQEIFKCVCVCVQAHSGRSVCMCVFSVGSQVSQGRQGLRESTVADLSVRGGCSRSGGVCVCVSAPGLDCSPP